MACTHQHMKLLFWNVYTLGKHFYKQWLMVSQNAESMWMHTLSFGDTPHLLSVWMGPKCLESKTDRESVELAKD